MPDIAGTDADAVVPVAWEDDKSPPITRIHVDQTSASTALERWSDYLQVVRSLSLPAPTLEFRDLSVSYSLPPRTNSPPSLFTAFRKVPLLCSKAGYRDFSALHQCNGKLSPGSMTLIFAPPGHGRSSLLKAIGGLAPQLETSIHGHVSVDSYSAEQMKSRGLSLSRLFCYVDQTDFHLPYLTVRETLEFAFNSANQHWLTKCPPEARRVMQRTVDLVIDILGLRDCEHTLVGNQLVRGISGGQKRRLSIGEALVSPARILLLDQATDGLDSENAMRVFQALRQWSSETGGIVLSSLLQPSPSLFSLFDSVLLLRHGQIIFHGPRSIVMKWIESLGVHNIDQLPEADFILDFLVRPLVAFNRCLKSSDSSLSTEEASQIQSSEVQQRFSTASLIQSFKNFKTINTSEFANEAPISSSSDGDTFNSDFARSIYGDSFSFSQHFTLLSHHLLRQYRLLLRNPAFLLPRLIQAFVFGVLLGLLFYRLSSESYIERFELMVFSPVSLAFFNLNEIPFTTASKLVFYKHFHQQISTSFSFTTSVTLLHFLLAVPETILFGLPLYFLSGFYASVTHFFFYLFILILSNLAGAKIFHFISYICKGDERPQQVAAPTVAFGLLFAGVLITKNNLPNWLLGFYYLSPFSWVVRSLSLNEFRSTRYDSDSIGVPRPGDIVLDNLALDNSLEWQWVTVIYLTALFVVFSFGCWFVLPRFQHSLNRGTQRFDEEESREQAKEIEVELGKQTHHKSHSVPGSVLGSGDAQAQSFQPIVFAFHRISYFIPEERKRNTIDQTHSASDVAERRILSDITSICQPRELIALMGASGAGKTTLLDILSGRKSSSGGRGHRIEGSFYLNGVLHEFQSFNDKIGFVEQIDNHFGAQTVREALQFSAAIRNRTNSTETNIPSGSISEPLRQICEDVLGLLELKDEADSLVGDEHLQGLSPAKLKCLSIGVELVSNCSILFLDEPLSGLTSASARVVMRVLRRVADSGRLIVLTLHQPSKEILFTFDKLLLLNGRGQLVYNGPIGPRAQDVLDHFTANLSSITGVDPHISSVLSREPSENPADWILRLISYNPDSHIPNSAPSLSFLQYWVNCYCKSKWKQQIDADECFQSNRMAANATSRVASVSIGFSFVLSSSFTVLFRYWKIYTRELEFHFFRWFILLLLGIAFGLVYQDAFKSSGAPISESSVLSQISCHYIAIGFGGVFQSATTLPVLFRWRRSFYREHNARLYSPITYMAIICLFELFFVSFGSLLFLVPLYGIIGLQWSWQLFGRVYLAYNLCCLCFNLSALLLVVVSPNPLIAGLLQGVQLTLLFLYSGLVIRPASIPRGFYWLFALYWHSKGLIASVIAIFDCSGSCPLVSLVSPNGLKSTIPASAWVAAYFDVSISEYQFSKWISYLVATYFVLLFMLLGSVRVINYSGR